MNDPSDGDTADYDVIVVGAGFAGLYQLHRLRQLGFSVLVLEAAAELGGIWHWNSYPGARVDSHVPLYEYSDPAIWEDWYWEERFPDRAALRRYFEHVEGAWDVRRSVHLATRVKRMQWDEQSCAWSISTDRAGNYRARFVVLCTGFAAKPYIPDYPGLAEFGGAAHHTARWPQDGIDLAGQRVGVIGTGASGVQVVQEAARVAEQLTVFQRTPILALPMQQRRITRQEQDQAKPGYPDIFRRRAESNTGFDYAGAGESTLAVGEAERNRTFETLWQTGGFSFWAGGFGDLLSDERANRLAYDFWRQKVTARIHDPARAALLAPEEPPHPFGVKRPSLEQTYYDVFNQNNVDLVDLLTTPITRVTKAGVETTGATYPLDVLVLATGFDAVTGGLTSIDIRGTSGATLAECWSQGVRTHLGVASHGFPNLLYIYGPQSPSGFCNGPTCAEVQGDWVIDALVDWRARGVLRSEVTPEAEEEWGGLVQGMAAMTLFPRADSWYMGANIPGKGREMLNWPGGLQLYLQSCRDAAADGYRGFVLNSRPAGV